jgi:hypothetical protein
MFNIEFSLIFNYLYYLPYLIIFFLSQVGYFRALFLLCLICYFLFAVQL